MIQRYPSFLAVCLNAGVLLGLLGPAEAGRVLETKEYFAVHGATLAEIDRSLSEGGPTVTGSTRRHPGATSVQFDGSVRYRPVADGCNVDTTHITLKLKTMLPRWYRPKRVSSRIALVWQTLADDIAIHEGKHRAIAISYLKRMESALKNLTPEPNCQRMEAKTNAVISRYLQEHEEAQQDFDIEESRKVDGRLYRTLQKRIGGARP